MDLSGKTVTLPSAITDTITNKLPLAGGTMTGNLLFGDSVQAQFGDSQDLRIYHDNTHSYIQDAGSGQLKFKTNGAAVQIIDGSNNLMINAQTGSSVDLYHSGSLKLATTSTGIDVTGTVTADGLTVDGAYSYLNGLRISGADTGNTIYQPTSNLSISSASGSISLKPSGTNILHATNTGVGIGATNPGGSKLYLQDTHTTTVTNATTMIANTTLTINGNSGQGSDVIRMGPMGTAGRQFIDVSNSAGNAAYDLLLNPISGGNVGIGTDAPNANLHTAGSSTNIVSAQVQNTEGTGSRLDLYAFGSSPAIQSAHRAAVYQWTGGGIDLWSRTGDLHFGTSNVERMRIDSSGAVTMPGQPVVDVRLNATRTSPGPFATHTVNVDKANNWNSSSHRFTATVAGRYKATLSGYTNYTNSHGYYALYVNNSGDSMHFNHAGTTLHSMMGYTRIFELAASDYITAVRSANGGTSYFDMCFLTVEMIS
jgi:hypothetical protein